MNQFIKALAFLQHLFDQDRWAAKAAVIIEAILVARSLRLSAIAQHMPGTEAANYKAIQRFLQQVDVKALLLRLFQADAPFVIGDPTEILRPQARKTSYVGKLKDGKTCGFWLLLLATPFRRRAIPCGFVTYSSKTIAQLSRLRNQYHWAAFDQLKELLGDEPLVLDREFSYLELLECLAALGVNFVICLDLGSHPSTFYDAAGRSGADGRSGRVSGLLATELHGPSSGQRDRRVARLNPSGSCPIWRRNGPSPFTPPV